MSIDARCGRWPTRFRRWCPASYGTSCRTHLLICGGDYVWTDAKAAYFLIGFSRPIPDGEWDKAVQIVKDGTRQIGATKVAVAKNDSGDHDVALSGADGVDFKLSSQRAAAYTSRSDCRNPQTPRQLSPHNRAAALDCQRVAPSVQPRRRTRANLAMSSHSMVGEALRRAIAISGLEALCVSTSY